MRSPSKGGPSPKKAEDPQESTGGEAGSEPGQPASRNARRTKFTGSGADAHASEANRGVTPEADLPLAEGIETEDPPTESPRPIDEGHDRNWIEVGPGEVDFHAPPGNANAERVELPHELDALLGIKPDGPIEESDSPWPSVSAPEPLPFAEPRAASGTPPAVDQTETAGKTGARAAPMRSATERSSKLQEESSSRPSPVGPATGLTSTEVAPSRPAPAEGKKVAQTVADVGGNPISPPEQINGNGSTAGTLPPPIQQPVEAPPAPAASAPPEKQKGSKAPVARRKSGWFAWFLGRSPLVEGAVTPVPPLEPGNNEIKLREYEPGTSYSRVYLDTQRARHLYALIEPPLDERETRALGFVKEVLLRTLDVELEIIERAVAEESLSLLDERVKKVVRDYRMDLSQTGLKRIIYYLRRDFTGYGPVDVMMHDPDIEDISCDGPGTNVFLYHRRYGSMESNVFFRTSEELDGFVIRMAQRSGKQITIADPLLDSSLPDGSRLQATLGREVTDNGSTFTVRRFRDNPLSPIDLVRMGTMSAELLAYCWIVVQFGANVMLAGGTASGKTTTLNTISLFIPPQAKIVSIEDTREINLPHKNWVRSVTRGGTRGNDLKRVDMFDLLTAALRQRPEYILVGEVRGKEATVAFQAMATGHTVLGTIHADSPRSVVYRLESEPINIPRIVIQSLDVILLQALLNVNGRRQRRIQEVAEIVGIDPASKELLTHGVFLRNPTTDQLHYTGRSYKLQKIAQRNNWTAKDLDREMKRRTEIINTLVGMPGVSFADIGQLFSTYENRPDVVDAELERLRPKGTKTEGTN